jgi:glycosyltransferase 2 family protein
MPVRHDAFNMMGLFMRQAQLAVLRLFRNRWAFRMIGIGVLVLILLKIDLPDAWQTLRTVDPLPLILSFVLQALALAIATFRWQLITRRLDIHLPFSRSFTYQLIGTSAALVTPGQLGEFIKVVYHVRDGFPVSESLLSVLFDRIYDVLMLLLLGFVALGILFGIPPALMAAVVAASAALLALGFLFIRNPASAQWIATALRQASPRAYKQVVAENTNRLVREIRAFKVIWLLSWGLLTVVNYAIQLFKTYLLFLTIDVQVSLWYVFMIVPLLRLVGLIPISISGIGTRDVTAIYLLRPAGISAEAALIVSMLGLITSQIQGLVGLLTWWRDPLQPGTRTLPALKSG